MCQDAGAALAYPDRIIPFIGIVDEDNPTCRQVAEFAPDVSDDNGCALIQAQVNHYYFLASSCGLSSWKNEILLSHYKLSGRILWMPRKSNNAIE
jgi:hypothetical protein